VIKEPRFRAPLLAGDLVYATNTHESRGGAPALYAFDAENGVERWSIRDVDANGMAAADRLLLVSTDEGVGAYGDAATADESEGSESDEGGDGDGEGDGSEDDESAEGDEEDESDDENDLEGAEDDGMDGDESEGEGTVDDERNSEETDDESEGKEDDTGESGEEVNDGDDGPAGDEAESSSDEGGDDETADRPDPDGDDEVGDGEPSDEENESAADGSDSLDVDTVAGAVEEQPGFGVLAGLGGVGAAAYALYTRGERAHGDES
jgi:hypothetical protein